VSCCTVGLVSSVLDLGRLESGNKWFFEIQKSSVSLSLGVLRNLGKDTG
jgi:hypothetical protein